MSKSYLIILDGFGLGDHDKGDAVFHAKKPFINNLFENHNYSKLKTDGESVGLPSFQMGGSEVGHITLGAGRPVKHLLTKINDQIDSGEFESNKVLVNLFKKAQKRGRIHFCGLVSDGGIHSFLPHLFGLQKMAEKFEIPRVFIHGFLDGRDVIERSAKGYLQQIEDQGIGTIASIGGRFFAMDRDNNWDRVEKAYKVMFGKDYEKSTDSWQDVLSDYYKNSEESDYYMPASLIDSEGKIESDDVVINFNYRTDRVRQISQVFCDDVFMEFDRPVKISAENYGVFGDYYESAQKPFSFGKNITKNTLGEVFSDQGKTQLRVSETEKFNHVTFFFSGEQKAEFKGEERILVKSPKCNSYAEKPEMSAKEQTKAVIEKLSTNDFDLVVQNYANADLVGHSGSFEATKKSIEVMDSCLEELIPFLKNKGYNVFITADHGNSDEMIFPDGEVNAGHTKNLVPFWALLNSRENLVIKEFGTLADVAPTILDSMHMNKPEEMTGESLVIKK